MVGKWIYLLKMLSNNVSKSLKIKKRNHFIAPLFMVIRRYALTQSGIVKMYTKGRIYPAK